MPSLLEIKFLQKMLQKENNYYNQIRKAIDQEGTPIVLQRLKKAKCK